MNEQYQNSGNRIIGGEREAWEYSRNLPSITTTPDPGLGYATGGIVTTDGGWNAGTNYFQISWPSEPQGISLPQPVTVYPDMVTLLLKRIEELERRLRFSDADETSFSKEEPKDEELKVSRKFRKLTEETK